MRTLAALAVALCLWAPAPAHANPLCRWAGLCLYLSPGFELTVVDAETGKPLPGVYAWAEWVQYGVHGRGGPLVVQDGFTGADGRLVVPRWGPRFGSRGGLLLGTDPAVVLFKPGYATLLVQNAVELGASQHKATRAFSRSGQSFKLQPFRGSTGEWVEHLRKLVYPGLHAYVSDGHRDEFSAPYLRRIDAVAAELAKIGSDVPEAARLATSMRRSAEFHRGEP
jgi:hypothetical protein